MAIACDQHFHEQIRRQTSVEAAALVLAECATALGWDLAAFHADATQARLPRRNDGGFIATSMGWSADCVNAWVSSGLGRHCPFGERCAVATDPFLWERDAADGIWFGRKLLPEQSRVLDLYGNFISGSVGVPVRRTGGRVGYVSWSGRNRSGSYLRRRYQETFSSTYLISHTFLRHIDQLAAEEDAESRPELLTARELECLTWAARGKTEDEIGIIIQRSRETAHFHLRNVVQKLNASNRAHAVAIACSRELISVR